MEAEYLMLAFFLGRVDPERFRKVSNHILSRQRADGSWGQYYEAPGDVSTSVECYFALKLAGHAPESDPRTLLHASRDGRNTGIREEYTGGIRE